MIIMVGNGEIIDRIRSRLPLKRVPPYRVELPKEAPLGSAGNPIKTGTVSHGSPSVGKVGAVYPPNEGTILDHTTGKKLTIGV
ncbi:unnamed protein product [marine sediment metagenome]|uniref:Uncharacterized protein n=1 Tax=marine sediment metagenome TaxID=412755 RepID=X1J3Y7_9ZZZZ